MIIDIPADEIDLGDILGEGMEVWCIVKQTEPISDALTIYWGPGATCLTSENLQDKAHRIDCKTTDIFRVLRRR